ncbi:F-box/LRR-repeat protein 14-like [Dorcoceras hygrometricum]|uniref:F-box/LRR-repeat protein 14-like n=1 Tax=Dorcoceras hygrometricum TaxID=472368 RepID=A0A2Z7CM13_9LAMI|nr:F-box/LRR-repeat protein 14-like [Dorcoceras hygrometricum]
MRIRPPELETSICDVKYHVSLSTGCVLGKWVCLVTLAMSLFDLQDVCIAIGSLATLDLPMVVDLIGIYAWKGPYCTLTTTNWFFQALSVIPRGSWGDVSRRFTMIRWAKLHNTTLASTHSKSAAPSSPLPQAAAGRHQAPPPPPLRRTCSGHRAEEFPSVLNSSGLLVQADEGVLIPVVDLIRRSTAAYNSRARFPCESGWSQAPRRQQADVNSRSVDGYISVVNTINLVNGVTVDQAVVGSRTTSRLMSTRVNAFSCDEGSGDVSRSHVGNVIAFIGEIWLHGSGQGWPEQGGRKAEFYGCGWLADLGFVRCGRFGWAGWIEYVGPLGSLVLNGACDPVLDFMPTDGEDL